MSHFHNTRSPHEHSSVYWTIVAVGCLTSMVCGTWGYWLYDAAHCEHNSWATAAYHALQLFILHMPHLEYPITWQLEVGRWCAPVATGLTGFAFLHRLICHEWGKLRLRFFRHHVVVCGLGETGTRIVAEFTKAEWKLRVVAIERDHGMPGVAEAEAHGALVVIGDARSEATLMRARALHARHVLAVCTGDDTNIAIATTLRKMGATRKNRPTPEVTCHLLWEDFQLRDALAPELERQESGQKSGISMSGITVPDLIARTALREHPFDFDGIALSQDTRVHLVLIGTCSQARALAVKALQMCHFANASRLRLTVVGADAPEFLAGLCQQHPGTTPWYDAMAAAPRPVGEGLPDPVVKTLEASDYLTVAVCGQGYVGAAAKAESRAVVVALAAAAQIDALAGTANRPANSRVLVHLRERTGFGTFLGNRGGGTPVHTFGTVETYCHPDALLHEKQDGIATELNAEYGTRHPDYACAWEDLNETFRDSNRLAADHIPVKLRALGMAEADQGQGEPADLTLFKQPEGAGPDANEIEPDPLLMMLAQMEHSRWCAERWLRGWRFHPAANEAEERVLKQRKMNSCLVNWLDLTKEQQSKDIEQLRATPAALAMAKKWIVKAKPRQDEPSAANR